MIDEKFSISLELQLIFKTFFAFEESLSRDKKNTRHFYNFNLIMHFYQEQHRFSTKIKGTPRENV